MLQKGMFQSTYLYKVRPIILFQAAKESWFQSTYLYKVRQVCTSFIIKAKKFQSTYLYKVRRMPPVRKGRPSRKSFNPRTYIRYDQGVADLQVHLPGFQSTYLYKVRHRFRPCVSIFQSFQSTYLYKVRLHYK